MYVLFPFPRIHPSFFFLVVPGIRLAHCRAIGGHHYESAQPTFISSMDHRLGLGATGSSPRGLRRQGWIADRSTGKSRKVHHRGGRPIVRHLSAHPPGQRLVDPTGRLHRSTDPWDRAQTGAFSLSCLELRHELAYFDSRALSLWRPAFQIVRHSSASIVRRLQSEDDLALLHPAFPYSHISRVFSLLPRIARGFPSFQSALGYGLLGPTCP